MLAIVSRYLMAQYNKIENGSQTLGILEVHAHACYARYRLRAFSSKQPSTGELTEARLLHDDIGIGPCPGRLRSTGVGQRTFNYKNHLFSWVPPVYLELEV